MTAWTGPMNKGVVSVAYPSDFDGSDPATWAMEHPDSCYAFRWPEATLPALGTWAKTEAGTPVIVVGHGSLGTFRKLETLVVSPDPGQ